MNSKLKCQLCYQKYKTPKMCPHCSHIYCHHCIAHYLSQKHFCPSCDNYIIDLVDCGRLVEEVQQAMEKYKNCEMRNQNLERSVENCQEINFAHPLPNTSHHQKKDKRTNRNLCSIHDKLQLKYYCYDCQKWLCSDCGVIENTHKNHHIANQAQTFQKNYNKVTKKINCIQQQVKKVQKQKQRYYLDFQVFQTQLKFCKTQIIQYCRQLLNKLQIQGKATLQKYQQKIKQCMNKIEKLTNDKLLLQTNLVDLQKEKQKQSQNFLQNVLKIPLEHHNLNMQSEEDSLMQNIFIQKCCNIKTMQDNDQYRQQIVPDFHHFTYEFDYRNNQSELYKYSDYFDLYGQEWRLKIYPKGKSEHLNQFLSVFLELKNGYTMDVPTKYVYRIELLSLNRAGMTIVKEFCSDFDIGECWGYCDYLNLNHIEEYLHQGRLLFSIGIRNHTYVGLSNDLKKYTCKMQRQTKILQKLLCQSNYGQNVDDQISMQEDTSQNPSNSNDSQFFDNRKAKKVETMKKWINF